MDISGIKEETKQNTCDFCSKNFKTTKALNLHKGSHNKIKPKTCRLCPGIMFNNFDEYNFHVNELHQGEHADCFICSACGKQFKTKSELTNHTNSKCGTIKLYKCEVCSQELMTPGSLYNHMLRHKGEPNFMCPFCAKLFLTAGQLRVHERSHTQEKVFICNVCGKGFCHRQSLITHSTLHTGIKPYLCENCDDSFSCVGNLLKHRKTHPDCALTPLTTHRVINPVTKLKVKINTPENSKLKLSQKQKQKQIKTKSQNNNLKSENSINPTNKCPVMEYAGKSENLSTETVQTNLSKTTTQIKNDNVNQNYEEDCQNNSDDSNEKDVAWDLNESPSNTTQCKVPISDEVVKSKCELDPILFKIDKPKLQVFAKEEAIQHNGNTKCKFCEKVYDKSKWLLQHENECHGSLGIICDKSLKLSNIYDVIVQHNDSKKYKCSCCKESFIDKNECRSHQINVHSDLLTCQECDKLFSNPDSLRSHKNIFHKDMPRKTYTYVCERCGKQFRQKSALAYHEQNKCGSGPLIQCHVCEKSFSSVHVRNSHMRIHNAEKKLLCKFCGKRFHWKGQMKIHERSHTGEKPFTCLYCPKAFAYRESLITHSSLHTGIKPHLCEACGSRFSCIGNLLKHRVTHADTCGVWYSNESRVNTKAHVNTQQ